MESFVQWAALIVFGAIVFKAQWDHYDSPERAFYGQWVKRQERRHR